MRSVPRPPALLLVLVAALSCGRDGAAPPAPPAPGAAAETVELDGLLTDEGVECQGMRGMDGFLYTLTGDLHGLTSGDRVHVTGHRAESSICQQGTTLEVERIVARPPR